VLADVTCSDITPNMGELPTSCEQPSEPCCKCGCQCANIRNDERKMKEVILSVMERLSIQEKINDKAKQKSSHEMSLLVTKLQRLQQSLLSEQSRVKLLLTNKDNVIRSLEEENNRLRLKINNSMQESDSNARDNAESKSSTDVETCDKTIDTNAPDSLSEEIPNIENKNIDEYGGGTTTRARDSHTLEIKPPIQFVPTPKITTSKEFNNNLPEYVIVTDNLSKPGLVVLDSGDNDEGDKISIINNNLNIMTTDRTVLQMSHHRSALRQMTNHRAAVKPSDIKHRDKVKTVHREHKTLLSYWSDPFL